MVDVFSEVTSYAATDGPSMAITGLKVADFDQIYQIKPLNWYKLKPYSFVFYQRGSKPGNGTTQITMPLPIAPSNLITTTHFATNIVTTLYGIVEEHSEVRYYDITIQGTTGYAPTHFQPVGAVTNIKSSSSSVFSPSGAAALVKMPSGSAGGSGRMTFESTPFFDLGGFAQQTVGMANTFIDQAKELISGTTNETGIVIEQSGYVAFHNLYRMFLNYKRDTAAMMNSGPYLRHPLQFLNYKDNVKYDVIPRQFQLTRSAESPMLYNYSIVLKAFNLRNVDALDAKDDSTANKLKDLGLDDIGGSLFNQMQGVCGGAAAMVGTLTSGLGGLGG
jgi:hypothetical protein